MTTVDLKLGLNLTVGSVPVALDVEIDEQANQTVYTFDGSIQNAHVSLGDFLGAVGLQFGVDVVLPPELNFGVEIDYLVGQIIYTKPSQGAATTELGIAGTFDLGRGFVLQFYADAQLADSGSQGGNPYVIGAALDKELAFSSLPLVGNVPGLTNLKLTKIGFSYTNAKPTEAGAAVTFNVPQVSASANPLYTRSDSDAKNSKVYSITKSGDQQTFSLAKDGFSLVAAVEGSPVPLDTFALPMALPAAPPQPTPMPAPFASGSTSPPASPVHWIDVNKTFGPVNLQQIGLNYAGGEATFGFTATFTLGSFTLGLEGLTITFPLPLPGHSAGNDVSFDLQGLSFDVKEPSFTIGGAFLKVPIDGVPNYFGEVVVQAEQFGLKALGGYTPAAARNPASFFIYASIEVPLGGPPFLFITGLAGGFGINRTLILPTIDDLSGYILLPGNAPQQGATPSATIQNVLPQMEKYFIDKPGEYWVAVGIAFTSFEMIDAFALVTVAFGVDLQIGLLGTCAMTLPTGDPDPVAYIEIDILASYTPASGLLAVQGKLSPASFLYGGFCRLSGGFAFFTWFSGEHAGDFVVSVGGYHPAFKKPDWYPAVPRLTMAFGLGPFQVTGQAYFALTPSMMMAGLALSATWSSGPVKAWFNAGVDFLIAWAPFHYEAAAYVNIGCSVDLGLFSLSVQVGVDLSVWGPAFGGRADVDLDVISFSISFGAARSAPAPVGWNTFKSNFLPKDSPGPVHQQARKVRRMVAAFAVRSALGAEAPAPAAATDTTTQNIITASVPSGLLQTGAIGPNGYTFAWVVDPNAFSIATNSTLPANNGEWVTAGTSGTTVSTAIPDAVSSWNAGNTSLLPALVLPDNTATFSVTQVWNPALSLTAMNENNVRSYHTVALRKRANADPLGTFSDFIVTVALQPRLTNAAAALYGASGAPTTAQAPPFVDASLAGFLIAPEPRTPDRVSAVPLVDLLFTDPAQTGFAVLSPQVDQRYTVAESLTDDTLTITVGGEHDETIANSGYVLSALADSWSASQRETILTDLLGAGFTTYSPSEIDLTALATTKRLTDWPMAELLGAEVTA